MSMPPLFALATRIWNGDGKWIFLSWEIGKGLQVEWYDAGKLVQTKTVLPLMIETFHGGNDDALPFKLNDEAAAGLRSAWRAFSNRLPI